MFDTVLVANRGEIAVRVIRTLRALAIRSVAVYSDADAGAPHTADADVAVALGPPPGYLSVDRLLDAAARTGAQAVHPGYGFLSESADFARAVEAAGLVFVGPPAAAIEAMGDKIAAKRHALTAGVPLLPGVQEPGLDDRALAAAADAHLGYPLLVKAAAGGGGKGMRVVRDGAELPAALAAARREALAAFGDDELLLERWVERPRHVEVQVLADRHGACLHLGDRECSLQRRYQKVVEEAPAPGLDAGLRARMSAAAVALARAVGYTGVGTCEFLVDGDGFAFLEMNTRLQVEHPVTELVTGLDLVELQLRVAAGEHLPITQSDVALRGHAMEARVYAEDPDRGFLPTGGRVLALALPGGPGVRLDLGVTEGSVVGTDYDPMLGKVVAAGADREEALRRLDHALAGFTLLGVRTNVAFLRGLLADSEVRAGRLDTGLIARLPQRPLAVPSEVYEVAARVAQAGLEPTGPADPFDLPTGWRVGEHVSTPWRFVDGPEVLVRGRQARGDMVEVEVEGQSQRWRVAVDGDRIWLGRDGAVYDVRLAPRLAPTRGDAEALAAGPLRAPLPGTVRIVAVSEGDPVAEGQTLVVVEAMKMEHPITAPVDGVVTKVLVRPGQQVAIDAELAVVEPSP